MSIILVRHGETAGNFARIVQVAETPLNETGLRQADMVAARLATLGAVHLASSDQPRAHMTAQAIARHTGLPIELNPLLQERNMGDFRGRPYSEFTDFHPLDRDVNPPNGETWDAFHERAREAFAWMVERRLALNGPLIVVTHGLVLRFIFERLLNAEVPPMGFANTSLSILDAAPPHGIQLFNCARHLDVSEARAQV